MDVSEELREALLNLEEARKREAQLRGMAETLLEGLRVLVFTQDPQELFSRLFDVMGKALDFEAAFVLTMEDDGLLKPQITSDALFIETQWKPQDMFRRVMKGESIAVFDTRSVNEWRSQPLNVREAVGSALHFPIGSPGREAIFTFTHSRRGHFSRQHLSLARRFSMLASQAFEKLELVKRSADLEEKLRAEAALADLNQKLIESEKRLARAKKMEAVGLLAGGVAHDLNNILSGIVSYPDLILMDLPADSILRKPIKTIQESGLRAAHVVSDLLTIARGIATEKKVFNLNTIVSEYLKSPEHQRLEREPQRVVFGATLDPRLFNVYGSSDHIRKCLMNLVTNAAEAVKERGQVNIFTENIYLDEGLKGYEEVRKGEYVVLRVSDNGSGMSPEEMERIFEPFYSTKVMGRSGTGLGLAVVWNTVQDHGGYIDVTSDDKGTAFGIYFPATREPIADDKEELFSAEFMGNGQMILVVDDEEAQRQIAVGMLRKLGYRPWSVASGEEAVLHLKKHSVDLVVLDMVMPRGIDGYETYRQIIEIHPRQKAIMASGYTKTKAVETTQELGAGRYIRKPYTLARFALAVKEELEK